jgi:hypothetical protein
MSSGFRDKLYWRRLAHETMSHCFERGEQRREYVSLCGRKVITGSRGQAILRPIPTLRCGACDVAEMKMRRWSESGPATIAPTEKRPR